MPTANSLILESQYSCIIHSHTRTLLKSYILYLYYPIRVQGGRPPCPRSRHLRRDASDARAVAPPSSPTSFAPSFSPSRPLHSRPRALPPTPFPVHAPRPQSLRASLAVHMWQGAATRWRVIAIHSPLCSPWKVGAAIQNLRGHPHDRAIDSPTPDLLSMEGRPRVLLSMEAQRRPLEIFAPTCATTRSTPHTLLFNDMVVVVLLLSPRSVSFPPHPSLAPSFTKRPPPYLLGGHGAGARFRAVGDGPGAGLPPEQATIYHPARGVILTGLLRFFGGRRGGCVRAPRYITWQVESTARMNVSFAVKQDPTLFQFACSFD
jgi:hypothetical protein